MSQLRPSGGVDGRERPADLAAADRDVGVDLLAEPAALHDRDRLEEQLVVLAALLRADLKHAARFLHDVANAKAFFDRERERLFAVHVAAGPQRGDGDRHVPMVGRADRDDVRLLLFEQLAIVARTSGELVVELAR